MSAIEIVFDGIFSRVASFELRTNLEGKGEGTFVRNYTAKKELAVLY